MNKQATNKYLIISKRYAKALIKIAYQKGLVDTFLNDFSLIKEVLSSSSDLDELLLNPIVSSNKKKEIVVEVFGEKINSDVLNFLKILIDNNKFKIVLAVIDIFEELYNQQEGIENIDLVSAIELKEDKLNQLQKTIESKINKKVNMKVVVDSSIIAGLVMKIDDKVIDGSLKSKINNMKKQLI